MGSFGPESDELYDEVGVWPAFVDLLAATALLFVVLLAVVLVWVGAGRGGGIETQRDAIVAALRDSSMGFGSVYEVDTTDVIRVKLILTEDATFPSSEFAWDSLRSGAQLALREIAAKLEAVESLRSAYREIQVVGHSDQDPFSDPDAAFSNWELSAARAAVVARYLATRTQLDPCRVSATGLGPYYPIVEPSPGGALTTEQKRLNRRIELQFIPMAWESGARSGGEDKLDTHCYRRGDGTALRDASGSSTQRFDDE